MRKVLSVAALLVVVGSSPADVADAVKKLASKEGSVRRQGAQELSEAGPEAKAALEPLLKALAKDDDRFVRRYAAEALGNLAPGGGSQARAALEAALNDPTGGVRAVAIKSLTRYGADAIPALGKAVLTGTADVKETAVGALAGLGKPAFGPLLDVVKEPKVDVAYRRTALAGLRKLGDDAKPAVKTLATTAKNPRAGGQDGQRFRLELFAALGDLATKSDADAVALLDAEAKREKGNDQVKKAAATALKKIQGR